MKRYCFSTDEHASKPTTIKLGQNEHDRKQPEFFQPIRQAADVVRLRLTGLPHREHPACVKLLGNVFYSYLYITEIRVLYGLKVLQLMSVLPNTFTENCPIPFI